MPKSSDSLDEQRLRDLLERCESFIAGFEGDELQEGVDDLLGDIRAAIYPPAEQADFRVYLGGGGAAATYTVFEPLTEAAREYLDSDPHDAGSWGNIVDGAFATSAEGLSLAAVFGGIEGMGLTIDDQRPAEPQRISEADGIRSLRLALSMVDDGSDPSPDRKTEVGRAMAFVEQLAADLLDRTDEKA